MRHAIAAVLMLVALPLRASGSEVRSFKIAYRPASDAIAIVAPLLSPSGSLILQPQANTLLVRDASEVVEQVAAALAAWDVEPESYAIEIRVMLASNVEPTPSPRLGPGFGPGVRVPTQAVRPSSGPHFRSVQDDLRDLLRYKYYTDLDTLRIVAADGAMVEAPAAGRYYVRFVLRAMPRNPERVQLSQLEVLRREEDGGRAEVVRPLLRANVSLRMRQTSVIGTARSEDASEALVLVLAARREDGR